MARLADWSEIRIVALDASHDRGAFRCGKPPLDEHLQKYARQNDTKDLSKTYVAVDVAATTVILGYYTVRFGEVAFDELPDAARKKLPRYPVPVLHLARLASDQRVQQKGLGELLLMDALARAVAASESAGLHAVETIAKDDDAARFYAKYGFAPLRDDKLHMYLPLKGVRELLG